MDSIKTQEKLTMLDRVNPIVKDIKLSGIRRFNQAAKQIEGAVSLTVGEPEFDTVDPIKEAAYLALKNNRTHYPVGLGVQELREAISKFESKDPKSTYSSDEVIVTVGSTEALSAVLFSILEEGDEVIIPEPMYLVYKPLIERVGAKVVGLDTTKHNFQIDRDALSALVNEKTKAILITSPNNPTGVIYNKESLDIVVELALKYRTFLISDDVYNQLVYVDHLPSLRDYPEVRQQLIITQSFSKPYAMTGWRIGYILADQPIAKVVGSFHAYMVSGITTFVQDAAITALAQDTTWMRDLYHARRDKSLKILEENKIKVIFPEGAFYLFVDITEFNLSSEAFCEKALYDYKVAMVPGVYFGEHCDHYIRLSYATSEDQLYEGLARLAQFVSDLRK